MKPSLKEMHKIPMCDMRAMHIAFGDKMFRSSCVKKRYMRESDFMCWINAQLLDANPHSLCHHNRGICFARKEEQT